jgi:hypothetical protein
MRVETIDMLGIRLAARYIEREREFQDRSNLLVAAGISTKLCSD